MLALSHQTYHQLDKKMPKTTNKHDCDQHPQKAPIVFLLPSQGKDLLNSDKITSKGDLPFFASFRHLPPFSLSWDLTLFSNNISTAISYMSIFRELCCQRFFGIFLPHILNFSYYCYNLLLPYMDS